MVMCMASGEHDLLISEVSVFRGLHAPITATDITSRTLASTALGVLDEAI